MVTLSVHVRLLKWHTYLINKFLQSLKKSTFFQLFLMNKPKCPEIMLKFNLWGSLGKKLICFWQIVSKVQVTVCMSDSEVLVQASVSIWLTCYNRKTYHQGMPLISSVSKNKTLCTVVVTHRLRVQHVSNAVSFVKPYPWRTSLLPAPTNPKTKLSLGSAPRDLCPHIG
jgi:hypothetical protein